MRYDDKISVIRVLDRANENFEIRNAAYRDKIDVVNIVTSPEIEMLIICSENKYDEYCNVKSKTTPSVFCKHYLPELKYNKKAQDIHNYFDTPEKLMRAIRLYHQKHQSKGQYTLLDLLKETSGGSLQRSPPHASGKSGCADGSCGKLSG
ncbi:MAG: hypothetical protein IJ523_11945 [Succinivibrionaceae bacterium]|nr:hypothetical protein [Succinivibrionaceae bacterium]